MTQDRSSHTARFHSIHWSSKTFAESFKSLIFASENQIKNLYENPIFFITALAAATILPAAILMNL